MGFLRLTGKNVLVMGLANRKSVAWSVGRTLEDEGANVIYGVRSGERKAELAKLLGDRSTICCDVEREEDIEGLREQLEPYGPLAGFVHSIAFANYSEGFQPFHLTKRDDFLQAAQVSAFSLVELARSLKPILARDASVVTIGISSFVTAPTYGYMSPIKEMLEGCARFLAKSFSADTEVRFNVVKAGPLRTRSSAGIPGYLENYLYGEKLTFRKRAVETQEVADVVAWLLSERSSAVNGQGIVVNAGMDANYFDEEVVRLAMRPEKKTEV